MERAAVNRASASGAGAIPAVVHDSIEFAAFDVAASVIDVAAKRAASDYSVHFGIFDRRFEFGGAVGVGARDLIVVHHRALYAAAIGMHGTFPNVHAAGDIVPISMPLQEYSMVPPFISNTPSLTLTPPPRA